MTHATDNIRDHDIPLGATVTIVGILVGRSEFSEGPPSYLVEYERRGKPMREWFVGADLKEDGDD
ncbi:MAG: hypothetical protein K5872_08715 [Rhizobiaceae bacterium]|nr:hypothetical protein [Rhizobiaceae bacterium]MCV0406296.1 hypothetical protein [Rhizobiaceae bacterium]